MFMDAKKKYCEIHKNYNEKRKKKILTTKK